jgi:hypothetical protein
MTVNEIIDIDVSVDDWGDSKLFWDLMKQLMLDYKVSPQDIDVPSFENHFRNKVHLSCADRRVVFDAFNEKLGIKFSRE